MANVKETDAWEAGIYRLEDEDPVQGGEDGVDNLPHKQLANRTNYLKKRFDRMESTVEGYSPEMQQGFFAGLQYALDYGGLAMREHEQTRLTRFQEITATIRNRGIKSGVTLTKSQTATRNISCSDGVVFMGGREYPVANQTNTASVASNTTESTGVVIIYMFLTAGGVIDMAATTLNGPMPEGAIEMARAVVPAGNTEANDPYLSKVTITESSRREPGWPAVQKAPASVAVSLNRVLPNAEYHVDVEVIDCAGGRHQLGSVYAQDKLTNGFKLVTDGTADDVSVRLLIQHPSI